MAGLEAGAEAEAEGVAVALEIISSHPPPTASNAIYS